MIHDVADRKPVAARGDIDLAGRIEGRRPLADLHGAMLPPRFVERHPLDDGGMVAQRVDHDLEFRHVLPMGGVGPLGIDRIGLQTGPLRAGAFFAALLAGAGTDLILPDHHAEAIAVGVIAARLDLDVFAQGVEAGSLEKLDIRSHGGIGGRREQSVRPPTLIERAEVEQRLAVEEQAEVAVSVLGHGGFAQAHIRSDRVRAHGDRQIVERRRVGRPEFGIGNGEREVVRRAGGRRHLFSRRDWR